AAFLTTAARADGREDTFASTGKTLERNVGPHNLISANTVTDGMVRRCVAVENEKCPGGEVKLSITSRCLVKHADDCPGAGIDGRISGCRVIIEVQLGLEKPTGKIESSRACRRSIEEFNSTTHGAKTCHVSRRGVVVEEDIHPVVVNGWGHN